MVKMKKESGPREAAAPAGWLATVQSPQSMAACPGRHGAFWKSVMDLSISWCWLPSSSSKSLSWLTDFWALAS